MEFLQLLLQNVNEVGGFASAFSVMQSYLFWKKDQKENVEARDLMEWIDGMQRHEHQQIIELIRGNAEAFIEFANSFESELLSSIERLNSENQRRHEEAMSSELDPHLIEVRVTSQFTAEAIFQQEPSWQNQRLEGTLIMINRTRSRLNLKSGFVELQHGSNIYRALLTPQSLCAIETSGDAASLRFRTRLPVAWRRGEVYEIRRVCLEVAQSPEPLELIVTSQ